MKYLAMVLSVLLGSYSFALAQGNSSGRGASSGDPAAGSGNPAASSGSPNKMSNPSGSGTSPSGGKDDNPDHGFGPVRDGTGMPGTGNNRQK